MPIPESKPIDELKGITESIADELSEEYGCDTAGEITKAYLTEDASKIRESVESLKGIHGQLQSQYYTNEELGYPDAENPVYEVMLFIRFFGVHTPAAHKRMPDEKIENNPNKVGQRLPPEIRADYIDLSRDLYRSSKMHAHLAFDEYVVPFSDDLDNPTDIEVREITPLFGHKKNLVDYKREDTGTQNTQTEETLMATSIFFNRYMAHFPESVLVDGEKDHHPAIFSVPEYEGEIVSASLKNSSRHNHIPEFLELGR